MRLSFRPPAPYLKTIIIAIAVCAALVSIIKARAWFPRPVSVISTHENQAQTLEVEVVSLNKAGFEPAEIARPAGRFVLALKNRISNLDAEFRLDVEAGARLREILVPAKKRSWSETVDLSPGRYLLTEVNNPEARCLIIITTPAE